VALSDPGGVVASPLTIIYRQDEDADIAAINHIISRNDVGRVIVGLPFNMDGSMGSQAEKVQAFVNRLREQIKVAVELKDERLTTVAAQDLIKTTRSKKARKKERHDDAIAAAFILQRYLDEVQRPEA